MQTQQEKKEPQIVFNGIWFSPDGTFPDVVLSNMKQLVDKINASEHKDHYRVVLWTNRTKISDDMLKERLAQFGLSPNDIEIKDYRDVQHANDDPESKQVNQWVDQFAQADCSKSKLCYAMASDMFRMYLLTKEYPNTPGTIGCYLDCNDVQVTSIPDPATFRANGMELKYVSYRFKEELLSKNDAEKTNYFNNDLIIVDGKNRDLCNQLFSSFCHNLQNVDQRVGGFKAFYDKTLASTDRLDMATTQAIVFGSTHTMNILDFDDRNRKIFLRDTVNGQPVFHPITNVFPANNRFTRNDYDEGQTWAPPVSNTTTSATSVESQQWQDLFKQKRGVAGGIFHFIKHGYKQEDIPKEFLQLMNQYPAEATAIAQAIVHLINAHDENMQQKINIPELLSQWASEDPSKIGHINHFVQKAVYLAEEKQLTEANYQALLKNPGMMIEEVNLLKQGLAPENLDTLTHLKWDPNQLNIAGLALIAFKDNPDQFRNLHAIITDTQKPSSILHTALRSGNAEIANFFIQSNHARNNYDLSGNQPIHLAIQHHLPVQLVEQLLPPVGIERQMLFTPPIVGEPLLVFAKDNGTEDVVAMLRKQGATDPNELEEEFDDVPLHAIPPPRTVTEVEEEFDDVPFVPPSSSYKEQYKSAVEETKEKLQQEQAQKDKPEEIIGVPKPRQ